MHSFLCLTTSLTMRPATTPVTTSALQTVPSALLTAVDRIAENIGRDEEVTERQLARLGDYLRAALDTTSDDGTTPERRRRLDNAAAELRASGVSLAAAPT